jgi:hypothetical protein
MNMVFEKGEVLSDFRKTPDKKKVIRVSVVIIGTSLTFVVSKLFSMIILFKLRDAVDKVLREEQCGLRKGRGCVD